MKNKKLIAILGSILITIILAVVIIPKVTYAFKGDLTRVVMLKKDIKAGEMITEKDIEEKDYSEKYLPKGTIEKTSEIVGKYAKVDIFNYDIVTKDKIVDEKENVFYDGSNLVSVTLQSQPAGVSAKIKVGDVVKIYGYKQSQGDFDIGGVIEKPELQAVEVAYITTSDSREVKEDMQKEENYNSSNVPATVVLKVKTDAQAKALVDLEYSSKIHLELKGRGKIGQELLENQNKILEVK